MSDLFFDLFCLLLIIIGIISVFWLVWDTKLHYIYLYKKLKIGDVYELKYTDPWEEPKRIEIVDIKNKWIRCKNYNTGEYESISVEKLVDHRYEYIKNINDANE